MAEQISELLLDGSCFHNQPQAWQTMIQIIEAKNPDTTDYVLLINEYLHDWKLLYVPTNRRKNIPGKVMGYSDDLVAWILAHV